MRYVEVRYKCRCMVDEATVQVPERHRADDAGEWITETASRAISQDHRRRSPLCQANVMEYAKFPADGEFIGQGKGGRMISRFMCWIGCHDWREMNGRCRECGYRDPMLGSW